LRRSGAAVQGSCPAARRAGGPPSSRNRIPLRPAPAPCRAARSGLPAPSAQTPPRISSSPSLHGLSGVPPPNWRGQSPVRCPPASLAGQPAVRSTRTQYLAAGVGAGLNQRSEPDGGVERVLLPRRGDEAVGVLL